MVKPGRERSVALVLLLSGKVKPVDQTATFGLRLNHLLLMKAQGARCVLRQRILD